MCYSRGATQCITFVCIGHGEQDVERATATVRLIFGNVFRFSRIQSNAKIEIKAVYYRSDWIEFQICNPLKLSIELQTAAMRLPKMKRKQMVRAFRSFCVVWHWFQRCLVTPICLRVTRFFPCPSPSLPLSLSNSLFCLVCRLHLDGGLTAHRSWWWWRY